MTDKMRDFVDEVKQLCKDFSDLRDRPYMGDVVAALDALYEQWQAAQMECKPSESVPEEIPQNWTGVDGAVAWHLIDRHGEGWAQIGQMMDGWLKANSITATELAALREKAAEANELRKVLLEIRRMLVSEHLRVPEFIDAAIAQGKGE